MTSTVNSVNTNTTTSTTTTNSNNNFGNTINDYSSGFLEMRFPEDIACGSLGGPEYYTDVVTSASGREQRNMNWAHARRRFNVMHGIKTRAQFESLLAFFHNCYGRGFGFRFKDWSDYTAERQLIGEGDGIKTTFQLRKLYESGTLDGRKIMTWRYITKPVLRSVSIYIEEQNRTRVEPEGESININYANGVVEFKIAPPMNMFIFADFEFDLPVRFDSDRLVSILEGDNFHSINDIPIVELKI